MIHSKRANLDSLIAEFEQGYKIASELYPAVTFLGSARLDDKSPYYKSAFELSDKLAKKGFNIITGGGNGIMEAANKAAYMHHNIKSVGFNIKLPNEQKLNPYTNVTFQFSHFYSRKYMLFNFSQAMIVFPGGFGTLDELFEVLTLIQTKKISKIKLFLYGQDFWRCMLEHLKVSLLENGLINENDLDIFILTDEIDFIDQQLSQKI
jgi:uncharacterized protein (TIGR00730 family)